MGRPRASLTFDDGPHPQTGDVLELLDRHHIRATFFQCGMHVHRNPTVARDVAAHHEIGNHTYSHPWLWRCLPATIADEVNRAQEEIQSQTAVVPRLFRSPYGVPGVGLARALRRFSLRSVGWTVIGQDWKLPAAKIAARVLSRTADRAIICLHDGRDVDPNPDISATISALRLIIPVLIDRGFEFLPAGELTSRGGDEA